jgi:hypothetical protein
MDKSSVNSFLIVNGKYFPKGKLNKIGVLLEKTNTTQYTITKRYFNPLTTTIIFWVFYPIQLFDRLILKDWFWGILKLTTPFVLYFFLDKYKGGIYLGVLSSEGKIIGVLFLLWGLWTFIDGFTIYSRTKNANYKAFLRLLNVNDDINVDSIPKTTKIASNDKNLSGDIVKWRENNPNRSLNEFYKKKQ